MLEVTTAPTPQDTIVRTLINARMDDGSPISLAVKVDTMLDHLGIANVPVELKRLIANGISLRMNRQRHRGGGRKHV